MQPMIPVPNVRVKSVHVREYTRVRFGKLEWVVQHYRGWPRR